MRRSICTIEPAVAFAGDPRTWRFQYIPATALPEKTILLFDIASSGRPIDWESPDVDPKATKNAIWAVIEGSAKPLYAKEVQGAQDVVPKYQFQLPVKLSAGKSFTIFIGDPKEKKWTLNEKGNRSQINAQRRRPFFLHIDPTGKGKFDEPETFTLDIKGNSLQHVKVITPSYVVKNKRFDVVIRFEDEYGNLTSRTPHEDTLIELTHEHLRENLSWKLFIPETGYITLPNLYFNEPGTYTITLKNSATKETFRSPPVRCFNDVETQVFWGTLHGESERVDSTDSIENCLRHFRDELSCNFYAASPFESNEETSSEIWKLISQNLQDFNEEDRFVTLPGCQWSGDAGSEGVRQLLFAKEQKQLPRKKDAKYSSLKKIYKAFSPKEMISIPCFTMGKGFHYNFKDFSPEFERVVEIYNSWGCSERTAKEGNDTPIAPEKKRGISETAEGSILSALKAGCRFGFVAGGLDDRGIYEEFYENEQCQYPPGFTAIVSKSFSREALFEALWNRSCYATTGERIILSFTIAGSGMGSEIDTGLKQGLLVNRHIAGFVAGTTKLHTVEIIRNGEVIKSYTPDSYFLDFEYDDLTSLDKNSLKVTEREAPFAFYYIRVKQEDGHMAWSSPIWVDIVPPQKREPKKVTKAPLKEEKNLKESIEDEGPEDLDFDD